MVPSKYLLPLIVIILFALFFFTLYNYQADKSSTPLSLFNLGKQQQQVDDPLKKDDDLNLEELDLNTLKFLLHGILTEKRNLCKNYTIHGRTSKDGGYDVCLAGKLRPEPNSCTVMSFGWSIQFHNVGIGKRNEINALGWRMKNLKTVIQEAGLSNKVIDVIKCDAEGAEWPFLEDVLENDVNVKQIILEIHSPKKLPSPVTKDDLLYVIKLFLALKKRGFVIGHSYHKYICCAAFSGMFPPEIPEKLTAQRDIDRWKREQGQKAIKN
ncbi:hypothetical protein HELRODRAFT_173382 [Helobdella robusta]|uniref:Methyltransferase domain-containing protein n=1 Tax=Helobdella robusta TaxID=6412 RepID=T1F6R1_HELRO|nr:hypothetical protein HELRODRAFT_173382 [Helobdella robusta]ESO03684.1 hypothetical protein HELRODRAFT_173382 [Helobdella robusta]